MILDADKYSLNENITEKTLNKNGFKNGTFKCYVYKNIIQLIIRIDTENDWWDYQIYNVDIHSIYPPYYDRSCGKHLEVEEIDDKVDKIINELVKAKILIKQENKQYEESGKI